MSRLGPRAIEVAGRIRKLLSRQAGSAAHPGCPKQCTALVKRIMASARFGAVSLFLLSLPVDLQADEILRLSVERDRITAGDVARLMPAWKQTDPSRVLGYAPLPGVQRRVDRRQLARWAKRIGLEIDTASLPDAVVVSRRMRRMKSSEVKERLQASLAQRHQLDPRNVNVELHRFSETLVPAGSLDFQLHGPISRLNEPASVALRWRDRDERSGIVWLRATVRVLGTYAVARRQIRARTELRPEDFTFQRRPLPEVGSNYVTTPDEIDKRILKYPLRSGEALKQSMLVKPGEVQRGDLIVLLLRSRSILLRVPGRAEQSGSIGDLINCRNLETSRRVVATIVDPKHAEVVFHP